jgi:hypothetical protein
MFCLLLGSEGCMPGGELRLSDLWSQLEEQAKPSGTHEAPLWNLPVPLHNMWERVCFYIEP